MAEIVTCHVRLTVEGIDRMYLNVFVRGLHYEQGILRFFRSIAANRRLRRLASTA